VSVPSFTFSTAARTHVGRVRQLNEDSYVARPDIGLWAVADGMGGHERGDEASRLIASRLEALAPPDSAPTFLRVVEGAVLACDQEVAAWPEGTSGSTVVALLAFGGHFALLWAGDSRAYRLREGRLERLTVDHSLVQELVAAGELTPEAARHHPYRNRITRAVGVGHGLELDRLQGELAAGDLFLLCSDGLTGELRDDEIASLLAADAPDAAADRLMARALESGGQDNVTLVLVGIMPADQDLDATVPLGQVV
jgi:serine/threonine protein phosphatase PrpC